MKINNKYHVKNHRLDHRHRVILGGRIFGRISGKTEIHQILQSRICRLCDTCNLVPHSRESESMVLVYSRCRSLDILDILDSHRLRFEKESTAPRSGNRPNNSGYRIETSWELYGQRIGRCRGRVGREYQQFVRSPIIRLPSLAMTSRHKKGCSHVAENNPRVRIARKGSKILKTKNRLTYLPITQAILFCTRSRI